MGRPKIAIIDDSKPQEDVKKPVKQHTFGAKKEDSLVAKLNEELGIEGTPEVAEKTTLKTTETEVSEEAAPKEDKEEKKSAKPAKIGKAKPRSKKYQEVAKDLDRDQSYAIAEAIDLVKTLSYSKFEGTLEAHINTSQTGIRGLATLPFVSGKKLKIIAFGLKTPLEDVEIGDETTLETMEKGKVNADIILTTPEWMPKLAKLAKTLGPKGLMPNPKNGTITNDLKKAAESFQGGQTEYRTESKAAVIHLALGKLNQPTEELAANVKSLLTTLGKSRVKKVTLAPTLGPGVKVNLASL
jgi:large subunit ribosomal protein L1